MTCSSDVITNRRRLKNLHCPDYRKIVAKAKSKFIVSTRMVEWSPWHVWYEVSLLKIENASFCSQEVLSKNDNGEFKI